MDFAKKIAAQTAIRDYFLPLVNQNTPIIVGIGSGSTIEFGVIELASIVLQYPTLKVVCIPTSYQAKSLILQHSLVLASLDEYSKMHVCFDGADEIDQELNCIKGGGGCHLQEKIIAYNCEKLILIADYSKESKILGSVWKKGVPLEILPFACVPIMDQLKKMGAKPTLRMAKAKMGPCISDNGNFIVDADFGCISDVEGLSQKLSGIPGVLGHGLFVRMASLVYIGCNTSEEPSVRIIRKE